jgi:hypothetical protein
VPDGQPVLRRRGPNSTRSGRSACATRTGRTTTRRPDACHRRRRRQRRRRRSRRSTSAPAARTTAGPTSRARATRLHEPDLLLRAQRPRLGDHGGFVYHGDQFPSSYQGSYFFADYTQNWIKRLTFDANGNVTASSTSSRPTAATTAPYGRHRYLVEGPEGRLYYLDLGYSGHKRDVRHQQAAPDPLSLGQSAADRRWARPTRASGPRAVDGQLLQRRLERSRGSGAHLQLGRSRRETSTQANTATCTSSRAPTRARLSVWRHELDPVDADHDRVSGAPTDRVDLTRPTAPPSGPVT